MRFPSEIINNKLQFAVESFTETRCKVSNHIFVFQFFFSCVNAQIIIPFTSQVTRSKTEAAAENCV